MDEQDRTDTIDNTEQTPESGPNFVMQDTPAGQSSEEARPASTLQGTYAQYRAQQVPPSSEDRQPNYNNPGAYPPPNNSQWRWSGASLPSATDRPMAAAWGSPSIRQSRRNRRMVGRFGLHCSVSYAYAHRSSAEFTSATVCCRIMQPAGTAMSFNSLQRPAVQMAGRM